MQFVIDRSKWICGSPNGIECTSLVKTANGKGNTRLLNSDGYMCCLGQIGEQLGCEKDKLLGRLYPSGIFELQNTILIKDEQLSSDAMDINDDPYSTLEDKEQKLTQLFAEHGHKIEFFEEYNARRN